MSVGVTKQQANQQGRVSGSPKVLVSSWESEESESHQQYSDAKVGVDSTEGPERAPVSPLLTILSEADSGGSADMMKDQEVRGLHF